MKNIFIISIFIFVTCLLNLSKTFANNFFEPEWSDFCPARYKNIDINRWHFTSNGRYWANRRQKFEKNLKYCQKLNPMQKEACFKELIQLEENKTRRYYQEKTNKSLRYLLLNSSF